MRKIFICLVAVLTLSTFICGSVSAKVYVTEDFYLQIDLSSCSLDKDTTWGAITKDELEFYINDSSKNASKYCTFVRCSCGNSYGMTTAHFKSCTSFVIYIAPRDFVESTLVNPLNIFKDNNVNLQIGLGSGVTYPAGTYKGVSINFTKAYALNGNIRKPAFAKYFLGTFPNFAFNLVLSKHSYSPLPSLFSDWNSDKITFGLGEPPKPPDPPDPPQPPDPPVSRPTPEYDPDLVPWYPSNGLEFLEDHSKKTIGVSMSVAIPIFAIILGVLIVIKIVRYYSNQ